MSFIMTQIFTSYEEFLQRDNKAVNGVSPQFAAAHPGWEKDNATNEGCWNCRFCAECTACIDCLACTLCVDCVSCNNCLSCSSCSFCSACRYCSICTYCITCRNCFECADCIFCNNSKNCTFGTYENHTSNIKNSGYGAGFPPIPTIENIHQEVLKAAGSEEALDMRRWHSCETTHCRAGWVVALAGKAGRILEQKTTPFIAAMQIYRASSPISVSPVTFYESNELALENMRMCAEMERGLVIA
jgi:hypothetical protein